jgi:hypothetical protein
MGQHGQRLNTGTCFSVSYDDKLVLFLFPGIPMGDPALVAFYNKRIYKKLRLKELSLSDPLYHGKKQHRNMIKKNRLRSVRTVINILHYLNPINCIYVYHMKTGVFQSD